MYAIGHCNREFLEYLMNKSGVFRFKTTGQILFLVELPNLTVKCESLAAFLFPIQYEITRVDCTCKTRGAKQVKRKKRQTISNQIRK